MESRPSHAARSFLVELIVYAGLVVVYVFFVISLLREWLDALYGRHKIGYAIVALLLIIGQGVVLEMVTTALLRLIRRRID
jgi:NADH:ubiquinone oxidoreductase subunit 6 (subunit J)